MVPSLSSYNLSFVFPTSPWHRPLLLPRFGTLSTSLPPMLCSKASKGKNSSTPESNGRVRRKSGDKRFQKALSTQKTFKGSRPTTYIAGDHQKYSSDAVKQQEVLDGLVLQDCEREHGNSPDHHEHNARAIVEEPAVQRESVPDDDQQTKQRDSTYASYSNETMVQSSNNIETGERGELHPSYIEDTYSRRNEGARENDTEMKKRLNIEIDSVEKVLDPENQLQIASDDQNHVKRLVHSSEIEGINRANRELNLRRLEIEDLAKKHSLSAKVFFYPEIVEAGHAVEIFLNRGKTVLADQPKILSMGAFNDWRWGSFNIELGKCNFPGDWWSFKLFVPFEANKVDFVFFDGKELYENNNGDDFSVLVVGGMNKEAFEDYLIEEKWKEAEKLAAERLEKEQRTAEEKRSAEARAAEEADRAEARRQVNDLQDKVRRILHKAVTRVDGLWRFEPSVFQGGDTVTLFYNRAYHPLASSKEVWIHGGYNNWHEAVSIVGRLAFAGTEAGDWWCVEVSVPKHAYVLNWVFADGPPGKSLIYDNNSYQDFHSLVPKGVPDNLFWEDVEHQTYENIRKERQKQEEAARMKAKHTARLKEQMKTRTRKLFLQSQAHIFYTDPVDVQAGNPVTVFYNPSNTILNGKLEVWIRGSFNRWTHRSGCFTPVKMQPAGNNTHLKAVVNVPRDVYIMDFVFSERGGQDGGVYDNNYGLDYHVPVVGGIAKEPPMHIVHISVEMAPIAKVGGLGDVVTSLSRAVQDLGHHVEVILPKYDCLDYKHVQNLEEKSHFFCGGTRIRVWNGNVENLSIIFLDPENGMFCVRCIYGRRDDGHRFAFFCNAALEYLVQSGQHPDIIHCHDWPTAPVAWLFQESYKQYGLSNARIVFTIHNLEYGTSLIGKAMANAHKATTVSYTYAQEISRNPAIAPFLYKFSGIRNGIDLHIWDPYNDPYIPMQYTSENVTQGKRLAKVELQCRLHLEVMDGPLVGIVTRLTAQKGIHLIKHGIWRALDRGCQVVLLGSAPDPRIQSDFNNLANQLHNTKASMAKFCLSYDEPLSHLIYAASDFILVPSIFEPCGLTQLIAMRYGAIPVVRRTGGLNDTIFDVDHDRNRADSQGLEPNGYSFDATNASGVDYALNRALSAWYESREWFNSLCRQVMEQDWSWNRPALDYIELYYGAKK